MDNNTKELVGAKKRKAYKQQQKIVKQLMQLPAPEISQTPNERGKRIIVTVAVMRSITPSAVETDSGFITSEGEHGINDSQRPKRGKMKIEDRVMERFLNHNPDCSRVNFKPSVVLHRLTPSEIVVNSGDWYKCLKVSKPKFEITATRRSMKKSEIDDSSEELYVKWITKSSRLRKDGWCSPEEILSIRQRLNMESKFPWEKTKLATLRPILIVKKI